MNADQIHDDAELSYQDRGEHRLTCAQVTPSSEKMPGTPLCC
jgi:hypothetical protein